MNNLFIIGRLVRDPELKHTKSGKTICSFTVAVNRPGKQGAESTDFFRVTAFERTAENVAKYLEKGSSVAVRGSVSLYTFTAQDGRTIPNLDVNAHEVEFLGGRAAKDPPAGFTRVDGEMPF